MDAYIDSMADIMETFMGKRMVGMVFMVSIGSRQLIINTWNADGQQCTSSATRTLHSVVVVVDISKPVLNRS